MFNRHITRGITPSPKQAGSQTQHALLQNDGAVLLPGLAKESGAFPYSFIVTVLLMLGHVALGLIMHLSEAVATAHGFGVGLVALLIVFKSRSTDGMLAVMGYAISSTVIWRVTSAQVFWFFPEYLSFLILLIGMRRIPAVRPGMRAGFVFLLLLLPSALLTVVNAEFGLARQQIAYALVPHAVSVLGIYHFSRIDLDKRSLLILLFWSTLPILASWSISANNVFLVGVNYGRSSNFFASGGAAPNQVSLLFSFGAIALISSVMLARLPARIRLTFLITAVALVVQSIMTFSRGGVYNLLGFFCLAIPFSLADKKRRIQFTIIAALILYPFMTYVLPALDVFTKGALEERYEREGETGRDVLAEQDIAMFLENPILGVGPGMGRELRSLGHVQGINAHTEYTRLLGEHGLLGLAALIVLGYLLMQIFRKARYNWQRGIVAGLIGWSLAMFLHAGTRVTTFAIFFWVATALANYRESGDHDRV